MMSPLEHDFALKGGRESFLPKEGAKATVGFDDRGGGDAPVKSLNPR